MRHFGLLALLLIGGTASADLLTSRVTPFVNKLFGESKRYVWNADKFGSASADGIQVNFDPKTGVVRYVSLQSPPIRTNDGTVIQNEDQARAAARAVLKRIGLAQTWPLKIHAFGVSWEVKATYPTPDGAALATGPNVSLMLSANSGRVINFSQYNSEPPVFEPGQTKSRSEILKLAREAHITWNAQDPDAVREAWEISYGGTSHQVAQKVLTLTDLDDRVHRWNMKSGREILARFYTMLLLPPSGKAPTDPVPPIIPVDEITATIKGLVRETRPCTLTGYQSRSSDGLSLFAYNGLVHLRWDGESALPDYLLDTRTSKKGAPPLAPDRAEAVARELLGGVGLTHLGNAKVYQEEFSPSSKGSLVTTVRFSDPLIGDTPVAFRGNYAQVRLNGAGELVEFQYRTGYVYDDQKVEVTPEQVIQYAAKDGKTTQGTPQLAWVPTEYQGRPGTVPNTMVKAYAIDLGDSGWAYYDAKTGLPMSFDRNWTRYIRFTGSAGFSRAMLKENSFPSLNRGTRPSVVPGTKAEPPGSRVNAGPGINLGFAFVGVLIVGGVLWAAMKFMTRMTESLVKEMEKPKQS